MKLLLKRDIYKHINLEVNKMANIEFVEGIRCKKCGKIIAQSTIFTRELCQGCGAKLIDTNINERTYSLSDNAESVTIKVTHKFFKDVYEVVSEV